MNNLNPQAVTELGTLLTGTPNALAESSRLRGLIADRLSPHFPRETRLINAALEAEIPQRLQAHPGGAVSAELIAQLAREMEAGATLTSEQATWAIRAWMTALGVTETRAPEPAPEPGPSEPPWYRSRPFVIGGGVAVAGVLALIFLIRPGSGGDGGSSPEQSVGPPPSFPVSAPAVSISPASAGTGAELDPQLPPTYGSTALTQGFTPDPHVVSVTSGGPINAEYIEGCEGWAAEAPDYRVEYSVTGPTTLLRFYFVAAAGEDTTMVVLDPDGTPVCDDDSGDGLNPLIDFESPGPGLYDIWVGSFQSGQSVAGSLNVTELVSNP